jgi:hypothetical protein
MRIFALILLDVTVTILLALNLKFLWNWFLMDWLEMENKLPFLSAIAIAMVIGLIKLRIPTNSEMSFELAMEKLSSVAVLEIIVLILLFIFSL